MSVWSTYLTDYSSPLEKENITSTIYTRLKLVAVCSWHHAFLVVSCVNQVNITLASAVCCETGTSPGLFSFPWFGHTQATFTLRCMTCWKVWLRFVAYFNSQAFSHNPVLAALVGETLCKQSVGLLPHMKLKAEWVLCKIPFILATLMKYFEGG